MCRSWTRLVGSQSPVRVNLLLRRRPRYLNLASRAPNEMAVIDRDARRFETRGQHAGRTRPGWADSYCYRSRIRTMQSWDSRNVNAEDKLESLLLDARHALAALDTIDNSVVGLVDRVGSLRYAEGTLIGFMDALLLTDVDAARLGAPRIEEFVSQAIAARLLLK